MWRRDSVSVYKTLPVTPPIPIAVHVLAPFPAPEDGALQLSCTWAMTAWNSRKLDLRGEGAEARAVVAGVYVMP